MKKQLNLGRPHNIIALNEHTFISPIIEKAGKYLKDARNKEGDWGYYKGFPLDIHASSLAIEALRMYGSHKFETSAEDAAVRIKNVTNEKLDTLSIQQLVDLLNILSGSKLINTELESKLVARLKNLRHNAGWGNPEPSISLSCEVILSLMKLKNSSQDVIEQWIDHLSQYQRSDGGWGATPDSESAIIPTCQALRVFTRFSDKSMAKIRLKAIDFLRNYPKTKDWSVLGDTFTISTVLRTLGEIEDFPFKIVQDGIDALQKSVNLDGGWGAAKEETSNIEYTALSIIALFIAGENKFVPSRLAIATLDEAESGIKQLRNEHNKLLEDIELHVQEEMCNIIQERDALLKKKESHQFEIRVLESKVIELKSAKKDMELRMEQELALRRYRFLETPDYQLIIKASIIVTIVNVSAYFMIDNPQLLLLVIGTFTLLFISYLLLKSRDKSQIIQSSLRPERGSIVFELIDLLSELPPSMREDFLFRLFKEGRSVPSEESDLYAHYMSKQYMSREQSQEKLQELIFRLISLPPSAQQNVIDEVQNRIQL